MTHRPLPEFSSFLGSYKEKCACCNLETYKDSTTHCEPCGAGPLCESCVCNDSEHWQGDIAICTDCFQKSTWCYDCRGFLCLEGEVSEGSARCAGNSDTTPCPAILCETCSSFRKTLASETSARSRCSANIGTIASPVSNGELGPWKCYGCSCVSGL
jgi:hypothetical protein